jgi:uncharacterized membrane protein
MLPSMTVYVVLKFVHVLLAIVAIGFNASYGIWLARAGREPEHALHVLRGIKTLDDRFANPAYGLLLLTGFALLGIGGIPMTTFWIVLSLALYVVVVVMGIFLYSPTLKRQIAVLEAEGVTSDAYRSLASRGRTLGILMALLVVAIEFFMVTKPTL